MAYEAYCKSTGGVSRVSGKPLPPFDELDVDTQLAWVDAAAAVVMDMLADIHRLLI